MKYLWMLALIFSLAAKEEKIGEKLTQYSKVLQQKAELNKQKRELSEAIISEISNGTLETDDCKATCRSRLSIRTSLEEARKLGATKMVEQVDKKKIKELYLSGVSIEGVEKRPSLVVKSKKGRS
jgi:hypothetical protein